MAGHSMEGIGAAGTERRKRKRTNKGPVLRKHPLNGEPGVMLGKETHQNQTGVSVNAECVNIRREVLPLQHVMQRFIVGQGRLCDALLSPSPVPFTPPQPTPQPP